MKLNNANAFFDLPRSHLPYQPAWNGVRVIHTFRHPINFITCCYLFKYNADARVLNRKIPLNKVVDKHINEFALEFGSHKLAAEKQKNLIYRINFDDFVNDSARNLKNLFDWIGLETCYSTCKQIDKYIQEVYPNLYVGAGEAWMRNGKGKPTVNAKKQQDYFLKHKCFNYPALWEPALFQEVNEVAVKLGFESLVYE